MVADTVPDDCSTDSPSPNNVPQLKPQEFFEQKNKIFPASGGEEVKKAEGGVQLEKRIGLWNGVAMIVGICVGSGIFISPRGILENTGSAGLSLALWLVCGIYCTLGALCYAELGTSIPKSGGDYAYLNEAFGKPIAFMYLWVTTVVTNGVTLNVVSRAFANYVLKPFYSTCHVPELASKLTAGCLLLFLTFVNCYSVPMSTRVQNATAMAKVGAIGMLVGAAIWHALWDEYGAENLTWERLTANSNFDPGRIALAFYGGGFSFFGWSLLNLVTEEIKDAHKNLPRAIYISIPLVTLIYVATNAAYFTVLTPAAVLDSSAVAVTFAEKVLGFIAPVMPLLVALSCLGTANGMIFTYSRSAFAGARDDLFPESLAMINPVHLTPMPSLISMCLISLLMLVTFSDIEVLINVYGFSYSLIFFTVVLGLLKLRWQRPKMERPIKVNLIIPVVYCLVSAYIIVFPFTQSPYELTIAAIISFSGLPFYYVFIAWENKPACIQNIWVAITHWIQKLTFSTVSTDEPNSKND